MLGYLKAMACLPIAFGICAVWDLEQWRIKRPSRMFS
jgi:hypothetical protein